ncbi:MAG: hypothetical protein RLZZ453_1257 [Chlamydiota bacterium]
MLYLLPNLLSDHSSHADVLPSSVDRAVASLTHLIAEDEKQGRLFLRRFLPDTFRTIPILVLNEHSTSEDKKELVKKVKAGGTFGLVSDCGMPCLADPGADLVLMLRSQGVPIRAFSGPSSILLALVLSGLGGQKFTFHGYLPKEEGALIAEIRRIEGLSHKEGSTHLFIETPYRNERLFNLLLQILSPKTLLSVAIALTSEEEVVETLSTSAWRVRGVPPLHKKPSVFSIRNF